MDFLNNDTQGNEYWHNDRLGRFTASRYPDLMKNGRGKDAGMGETAKSYVLQIAYEIITGVPQGFDGNFATEWGNENEPIAVASYEMLTNQRVTAVGFCAHPSNSRAGGSPDGLIGSDGMIEVKCPYKGINHAKNVLFNTFVSDYEWQVQGNLWITGRNWCDMVSFDPRVEGKGKSLHVVRVLRDEDKIALLESRIEEASKLLDEYLEMLGYVEEASELF